MVYYFRSKAGTFTISPDDQCAGMYQLCIGGMWLATYESAEIAAHEVLCKKTGWHDWDCREDVGPGSIEEWDKE